MKEESIKNMQFNASNMFLLTAFNYWTCHREKSFFACYKHILNSNDVLTYHVYDVDGKEVTNKREMERFLLSEHIMAMLDSIASQIFCYFYENIRKNYETAWNNPKLACAKNRSNRGNSFPLCEQQQKTPGRYCRGNCGGT